MAKQNEGNKPWTPDDLEMVPRWWFLDEGIWIHNSQKFFLHLTYEQFQIMLIPEAAADLRRCVFKYRRSLSPQIREYIVDAYEKAQENPPEYFLVYEPPWPPEVKNEVMIIFSEWVDKWAFGSYRMLNWISLFVVQQTIFRAVNKRQGRVLVNKDGSPSELLFQSAESFAGQDADNISWTLRQLYVSNPLKQLETVRKEARETLRQKGYVCVREETLQKWVWRWVQVKILGVKSNVLIRKIQESNPKEMVSSSAFSRELKLFDDALGELK